MSSSPIVIDSDTSFTPPPSHTLSSTMTSVLQKRTLEERKEGDTEENSNPSPHPSPLSSSHLLIELRTILSASSWRDNALRFAEKYFAQSNPVAMKEFNQLMRTITSAGAAPTTATSSAIPILQPMDDSSPPSKELVQAVTNAIAAPPATSIVPPAASSASSSSTAPQLAPIFASSATTAVSSSPTAATSSIPPTTSAAPAAATPSDLLLTIPDISFHVPKGKFTLQITPHTLHLVNPSNATKNISIGWSDVELLVDVPDINKRDWLLVMQMKKKSGFVVGKKTHMALVMKFLVTDKVKPAGAKWTVEKTLVKGEEKVHASMQNFLNAGSFIGSKVSSSLLALLRMLPALSSVHVVGQEPAIYDSLKKLPCVNCKHGVEDGSLYFLRTGLMFIKPVLYIPISDIDGINPARGASSTFDMKVGIEGSKEEIAFQMIEPKEEANITKYCMFLAKEQQRIEKEEKAKKNGTWVAPTPVAAAAASSSSSSTPAAAASSSSSSAIAIDDDEEDPVAVLSHGADGVSAKNIMAGPRSSRAGRPRSFAGMEDEDEDEKEEKQKKKKGGEDEDGDDEEQADDDDSSDDDEYDDGSASDSSDDSAEYDSEKDQEEINSEDEREKEKRKSRKRDDEDEDDESGEGDDDVKAARDQDAEMSDL